MAGVFALAKPPMFWVLASLAIIADIRPYPTPARTRRDATLFVSICFSFVILLLWGLGWAIVVQALATTGAGIRLRLGVRRTVFLIGQFAVSFVAADVALRLLGAQSFHLGQGMTEFDGLCMAVAAVAWFVVNYTIFMLGLRLRDADSWRQVFTPTLGYELLATGALLLLAPLFVGAPTDWALVLVFVPVLAISQLARLYNEQGRQLRSDGLTGLLSRRAVVEEIDDLVVREHAASTGSRQRFAVAVLDLDRFRHVNDAFGTAVGDRLLVVVAKRLARSVRPSDLVARLGGDTFALVLDHVADARTARAQVDRVARTLAAPADIDGQPIYVEARFGVALFPAHGRDPDTLIRHAEVAMYEAKQQRLTTAVYVPGVELASATQLSLLADLRQTLELPSRAGDIRIFYQPQVTIPAGDVVGAEALLRWRDPERGDVSVDDMLQVAEHSPVMSQLTDRVVGDAVAQCAQWNSVGVALRMSINVSTRDLETSHLYKEFETALQRRQVQAPQLTVEITETALMSETGPALATVRSLADRGLGIALDDFGTGFSSMAHLRRLPVTEIKIDRSFVSRMVDDSDDRAIVRSIIGLGHALGLRVVAEGVEDQETFQRLAEAGCDIAQGYFVGRPMPAEQFLPWLAQWRSRSGDQVGTHGRDVRGAYPD